MFASGPVAGPLRTSVSGAASAGCTAAAAVALCDAQPASGSTQRRRPQRTAFFGDVGFARRVPSARRLVSTLAAAPRRAQDVEPASDSPAGPLASAVAEQKVVEPVRVWNKKIETAFKRRDYQSALNAWRDMRSADVQPNVVTFSLLVRGFISLRREELAMRFRTKMRECGVQPNVRYYNSIIAAYARQRMQRQALEAWEEMRRLGLKEDVYLYGTLIGVFCRQGKFERVQELRDRMKAAGIAEDTLVFNTLIDALHKRGEHERAEATFAEMEAAGVPPDVSTFASRIDSFAKMGDFESAERLRADMRARGLEENVYVYTSLIDGSFRAKDAARAMEYREQMRAANLEANSVLYNLFVSEAARRGDADAVEALCAEMRAVGIPPDAVTFNGRMLAHVKRGDVGAAEVVWNQMLDAGYRPTVEAYGVLMKGYAKRRDAARVAELRAEMRERNIPDTVITWSLLAEAFARDRDIESAQRVLDDMTAAGLRPDERTLGGHLGACAKARNGPAALAALRAMGPRYGLEPRPGHYASTVDALCRNTPPLIEEALELLREMTERGILVSKADAPPAPPPPAEGEEGEELPPSLERRVHSAVVQALVRAGRLSDAVAHVRSEVPPGALDTLIISPLVVQCVATSDTKMALDLAEVLDPSTNFTAKMSFWALVERAREEGAGAPAS